MLVRQHRLPARTENLLVALAWQDFIPPVSVQPWLTPSKCTMRERGWYSTL